MANSNKKIGVWLIGAIGSVATCVVTGIEALKGGLISKTGLLTEMEPFNGLDFVTFEDIVFGGYDIRSGNLYDSAIEFYRANNAISYQTIEALKPRLLKISDDIKMGISINCGEAVQKIATAVLNKDDLPLSDIVKAIQDDISQFKRKYNLASVIVVNLASTEPFADVIEDFSSLELLKRIITENRKALIPASVVYAYSSIDMGCPYINFTPSIGSSIPAIDELSNLRGVPHMGRDGKTGETLVKTILAPLFAARNLKVLSWESHNILGNRDGLVLDTPANKKTKTKGKDAVLKNILPEDGIYSNVRIDYVPSLGDWKTAWDFIHFMGFMDTKMSMQFIWQGADSLLAAPLIIDIVRFTEFALRLGESGAMKHLAHFFKSPYKVDEQNFHKQFEMILGYANSHTSNSTTYTNPNRLLVTK